MLCDGSKRIAALRNKTSYLTELWDGTAARNVVDEWADARQYGARAAGSDTAATAGGGGGGGGSSAPTPLPTAGTPTAADAAAPSPVRGGGRRARRLSKLRERMAAWWG